MTKDEIIKSAADKLMDWMLPQHFYPDCYVSFDREKASQSPHSWPTGTNLLTHEQAQKMFAHCLPDEVTESQSVAENHGLDSGLRVCFYEQDFYVLSNFSSFNLVWKGHTFPTSEHAYHWEKFAGPWDITKSAGSIATQVLNAPSAHEAFKLAERSKAFRKPNWDDIKVGVMRDILRAKAGQHSYVRRKLLSTGDRELVENSWRDDFWGWGPTQDGVNMLGKLWMEIRAEIRAKDTPDN